MATAVKNGASAKKASNGARKQANRHVDRLPEEMNGAPAENLDKVRDLLFGAQMRDSDRRFARIEERMAQELVDLRNESQKHLESLEVFCKKEMLSLAERLKTEQAERNTALKSLSSDVAAMSKAMEKRLAQLDERLTKAESALRQELLDQSKTLREEMRLGHEQLTTALHQTADELQASKPDRLLLAGLFTEVAAQLGGEVQKKPARK